MMKFCVVIVFLLSIFTKHVEAQTSFGVANYYPVQDETVEDGSIVSFSPNGYFLSRVAQDPFMIGVVSNTPAIAIDIQSENQKTYPVIANGTAFVLVSTANGQIKQGDPITSSATPGVGMKNTKDGYVLGFSLQDFNADSTSETGKIAVSVNIRYYSQGATTESNLSDIASLTKLSFYQEPLRVLRYVVAGIILISSFVLGFLSFGRVANTGVESIGRNPLAGKMIQFGIFINVLITIALIGSGFGLAYLVLRL